MVFLTLSLCVVMVLSSQKIFNMGNYNSFFLTCILFLIFNLVNAFLISNILLFYFFFELTLVPTLMLIIGWGYQPERLEAGMYMMMYTISASLPLLFMLLFMFKSEGSISFNMGFMKNSIMNLPFKEFWWFFMVFAFMVKMPMYLTHLWLPKAHVEAPVSGSMILAGILLKLGGYGVIRFSALFPFMNYTICSSFLVISLYGAFMTSMICIRQSDIKSLIAYSSVGHMGLLISGLYTNFNIGWEGALVLMVSHGIVSAGLFSLINMVYEKVGSRSMYLIQGLMSMIPCSAAFTFLLCVLNMGCPPSINLLGEILLYTSVFSWSTLSYINSLNF